MKKIFLIVICCIFMCDSYAQDFGTGCLPETDPSSLPKQAELLSRDFENLPSSYSLRKYCPTPQSQGQYGTCTSWATAYAFRTILEAINHGWTTKEQITKEAFSPLFIYAQIKDPYDSECSKGSQISQAMMRLKNVGAAKKSVFNVMCASRVPDNVMRAAAPYKIGSYTTLVTFGQYMMEGAKISRIKKALCNNQPVVIAMHVYPSFNKATDVWDGNTFGTSGYHAMCVVGYDDNKYGGSFLIMNSWGTDWGNNGYTWVKYMDFCRTVDQAYTGSVPFTPSPIVKKNVLGGAIELKLSTGATMQPTLIKKDNATLYSIRGEYISGTRYRLYLTNKEPAYVYIIGFDSHGNTSLVFPPRNDISPALTYKNSHIAIPDEKWYIEMDANVGTDYMCVLYSKEEVDINKTIYEIKKGSGSIYQRVKNTLGSKLAQPSEITYTNGSIGFDSQTDGTIVPVIVAIKHV